MFWVVIGVVVLVGLIFLEGWRQAKYYGPPSGTGSSGIGSAMLELQKMLEPEKKVEMLLRKEDASEEDEAGQGDDFDPKDDLDPRDHRDPENEA